MQDIVKETVTNAMLSVDVDAEGLCYDYIVCG
jgi:hypothetical protein